MKLKFIRPPLNPRYLAVPCAHDGADQEIITIGFFPAPTPTVTLL